MKHFIKVSLCLFLILSLTIISAEPVKQIGWIDLKPKLEPDDDPFKALTSEQKYDLGLVFSIKSLEETGEKLSKDNLEKLKMLEKKLSEQGINIDRLIVEGKAMLAKRIKAAETMNDSLDEQQIRMAGYLLPLEFDGQLATEFLLVPYVGACIHTPPPPTNQIVHVKMKEGYKVKGLYSPVWVEGKLHVGKTTQDLFLGDGSADISVGYSLATKKVEEYKVSN